MSKIAIPVEDIGRQIRFPLLNLPFQARNRIFFRSFLGLTGRSEVSKEAVLIKDCLMQSFALVLLQLPAYSLRAEHNSSHHHKCIKCSRGFCYFSLMNGKAKLPQPKSISTKKVIKSLNNIKWLSKIFIFILHNRKMAIEGIIFRGNTEVSKEFNNYILN